MDRVVGVIPARYASTRFPGKMLADVHGKPLVVRTLEAVQRAEVFDEILVATDDERIRDAVAHAGGHAVMTDLHRPSGSDRVLAALKDVDADIVANIQGDEPLIPAAGLDGAVRLLTGSERFEVTTAAVPLERERITDPNAVKVVTDKRGKALYFSRSIIPYPREGDPPQQLYRRHVGLYVFRRKTLEDFCRWPQSELEQCEKLEQLRLLHHGVAIGVLDIETAPPGVDTPEDLELVRSLFITQQA